MKKVPKEETLKENPHLLSIAPAGDQEVDKQWHGPTVAGHKDIQRTAATNEEMEQRNTGSSGLLGIENPYGALHNSSHLRIHVTEQCNAVTHYTQNSRAWNESNNW